MSRRSWLPLAVVLLVMACSALGWAGDEVRDGAKFNRPASGITLYKTRTLTGVVDSAVTTYPAQVLPLPITVGGVVRSDTSSKALTLTTSGALQTTQMNRPNDDNTIVNLYMGSLTPIGGSATTTFYDMSTFAAATLHLSWTDSTTAGGAGLDSTAFEIIPFGKMSMTNDGWNFYLDIAPTDTSAALSSWFVTSPRNPWWVSTVKRYAAYVPILRLPNQGGIGGTGAGLNNLYTYSVSIPVATLQGMWFKENIIGFTVINRATAAGGLSILHNLSLDLVLKAN